MKKRILMMMCKRTLSALVLLMASSLAWAYDFEAENADGVTIYYDLINDGTEAEVTYEYENSISYSGNLSIPETATYNGKTLSVTSIGNNAFFFCKHLTSVTIPVSMTSIGHEAFAGCKGLTSITIPESVTSIDYSVFAECSNLTSIIVDNGNPVYDSRDNCNAIIETASNTLVAGCKNTIIPESVTSIATRAFAWCSSLTSVTIPESVTSIGNRAFYGCDGLTSVTIPKSVTSIGEYAFLRCYHLTSVIVDKDNPVYDSRDNCNALIKTATNTLITGCQNTVIPEGVTSMCNYAFYNCDGLTSITIPKSVTSIGDWAFMECDRLTSVTILGSETEIGGAAFENCSDLASVTILGSVTSIGDYAFYECTNLTSVTVPEGLTSIGNYAFLGCKGLTSVHSRIENPFTMGKGVFDDIADNATLYVPRGRKEAYESAGWTGYFSRVVEE